MGQYALHGHLKASAGNAEKLGTILLEASELVAKAKGCKLYLVSTDPKQADTVWITEVWESKEDHGESLKYPGVRELIGQAIPLLAGQPQLGQELDLLGGFGLS